MYLRYYAFSDYPFSVTPDPAFLYLSASHREALGHLLYGAGEHGGFVALTGEVGTGKTTLIRALVDNDMPDLDIALCWNPHLGVTEFVATICDELGVAYDPRTDKTLKLLVDRLNAHLLKTHAGNRRTVLIIDEAQNLSRGVLEQLRLLTNLETHKHKLLRIILVGQPELEHVLARHDLRQLAQRITARFRLRPLDRGETNAYVQHRLGLAGGPRHVFTAPAIAWLRYKTGGVPRLINMVCERALMGGYAKASARIGLGILRRAAAETLPQRARPAWRRVAVPAAALLLVATATAITWYPGIKLTRAAQWIEAGAAAAGSDSGTAAAGGDAKPEPAGQKTDSHPPDASARDAGAGAPAKPKHEPKPANNARPADKPQAKNAKTAKPASAAGGVPDGDADLNQLLRLWGVFGSKVQSRCGALRVGNLRCLADRGNFAMVERFNRPALLTIHHDGRRQKVLLSALDADQATLVGADGTRHIGRDKLLRLWTGRFEIVWRADSGVSLIRPGAVGNAVVWLRKRLARAAGDNPATRLGPPSPVYDGALKKQLEHFQLVNGLKPDGMAGPRTQMALNGAVATPGAPVLKPVK